MDNLEKAQTAFDDLAGGARGVGRWRGSSRSTRGTPLAFCSLPPGCSLLPRPPCLSRPPKDLLEGEEGFALSQGTWQRSGWRELDDLRK
jgi:hypothetical protein